MVHVKGGVEVFLFYGLGNLVNEVVLDFVADSLFCVVLGDCGEEYASIPTP